MDTLVALFNSIMFIVFVQMKYKIVNITKGMRVMLHNNRLINTSGS